LCQKRQYFHQFFSAQIFLKIVTSSLLTRFCRLSLL
jgi:hypothetical protein